MSGKQFFPAFILLLNYLCVNPVYTYGEQGTGAAIQAWLGLDLDAVYKKFGVPQEVFSYRADPAAADNVVFYYKNHIYLFWYENRVWVVRFDERYEQEFLGLKMGMSREDVLDILGGTFTESADSLIFYLPDRGYPVRLRLFFKVDVLFDAYLYRGDF
jgi:hypothetical protein